MAFAALAAGQVFLMPVTLAILLFFVFVPVRRVLLRRGIPAAATAGLVVIGLLTLMVLMATLLVDPASQLITNLPQITGRLEAQFEALRGTFTAIQQALASFGPSEDGAPVDGAKALLSVLAVTPAFLAQSAFVLVLLFFLLASADLLYLKIVQSFDTLGDKRRAYSALREIEDSLGSYLGSITLINAGLGLAIGLVMWAFGMPSPVLFGAMAFLLNFIPYIGALAGTAMAIFVALITYTGYQIPLMVGLSYFALTTIEGQLVTPFFVARRLQMNAVVVFLAVAMWAWLWSVLGMIVAVPVLVVASVICDHMPGLEKLGNFLAGEDPPAVDTTTHDDGNAPPHPGAGRAEPPADRLLSDPD